MNIWGLVGLLKLHPLGGHEIYIPGASAVPRPEQTGPLTWGLAPQGSPTLWSAFHLGSSPLVSGTDWGQKCHLSLVPWTGTFVGLSPISPLQGIAPLPHM